MAAPAQRKHRSVPPHPKLQKKAHSLGFLAPWRFNFIHLQSALTSTASNTEFCVSVRTLLEAPRDVGADAEDVVDRLTVLAERQEDALVIGVARIGIVAMLCGFHGRTLTGISATGQEKVKKGFEPMVEGFRNVPLNVHDASVTTTVR